MFRNKKHYRPRKNFHTFQKINEIYLKKIMSAYLGWKKKKNVQSLNIFKHEIRQVISLYFQILPTSFSILLKYCWLSLKSFQFD